LYENDYGNWDWKIIMSELSSVKTTRKVKNSSITEVAQLAGKSVATVSRYFNNSDYVSKKTAEQIREVAERLNYRPDSRGRSLRSGKHWNLGIIVSIGTYHDAQYNERMVSYLSRWITNHEYGVSLEFLERGKGNKLEMPALLASNKVDGIVVIGHLDPKELKQVSSWDKTTCLIENRFDAAGFSSACLAHKEGSAEAASYLVSLGHKKIGYVHGSLEWPSTNGRFEGYKSVLKSSGIGFNPDYVIQVDDARQDYRGGYDATLALLKKYPEITAIMYVNDWYAVGGLAAVQSIGRRVPEDISIVGNDDHWMASEVTPQLTTVSVEMDELCRLSVELLLRAIEANSVTQANVIVRPQLVVRKSCISVDR
jgi:LacI family transcriptional regulator